jgi:PEP-CTERM motif
MKLSVMAGMAVAGVLMSGTVAGLALATSPARAGTVCLTVEGVTQTPTTGTQGSCTTSTETEVKLNDAKNVNSGTGLAGTLTVDFASLTKIDLANGNATITPTANGNDVSFGNLDVTTPGATFTDILFGVQMTNLDATSLTVEALNNGIVVGAWSLTGLPHDSDQQFNLVGSLGTSFDEVSLIAGAASGIKEAKQFDLSGISSTVPEPSTWAMMLLGFAGLAYAGFRKTKGARAALSAG